MIRSTLDATLRTSMTAVTFLLSTVAPAAAQDTGAEPTGASETTASRLPADSMELGETYVDYLLDYDAPSLWEVLTDDARERLGSVGDFRDRMGQVFRQIGSQERVIDRRYWTRDGKPQYWHTAEFSEVPEPVVLRLVIEPDGKVSGLGINPQSQNPPVDDPNQHGDGDGPDGDGDGPDGDGDG